MKKKWIYSLSFLAIVSLINFACRKPNLEKADDKKSLHEVTGQVPVTISMEEIYAQLPQTIMYNLTDKININVKLAEWRYEAEYLMVRIPLNQADNKSYLYAVKPYNNPLGRPHVFLSQLLPETGSTSSDFSGRQMWLNLQDWKVYGVRYGHNNATEFMDPISINPAWESTMLDAGLFYLNSDSKIAVYDDPTNPDATETGMRPTDDRSHGDRLIGHGSGKGFFGRLLEGIGDIVSGIGRWLGGLGDGSGGPDNDGIGGGSWSSGWPDGDYGGGGAPGGWGGPSGGGGGGYTPPPPPEEQPPISIWDANMTEQLWATIDEPGINPNPVWVNGGVLNNNASIYAIENPTITYLVSTLGLNQTQSNWLGSHLNIANNIKQFLIIYVPGFTIEQKKGMAYDHLKMMMENPDYLNQINNLTGNWWDVDQDGLIIARKIQMELYLQANPQGMLDCNELATLPMTMYQNVASYQIPQSLWDRIQSIRDNCPPPIGELTPNNFNLQTVQQGEGVDVNCDYFTVHVNQLPQLPNGIASTPDNFLEYFRTHINQFISPSLEVTFAPYVGHTSFNNVYLNDETLFNSSFENSLGSVIHINMADDGSVMETNYTRNFSTNSHRFMFTTMVTPIDGLHPVAGNRQFGIFSDPNGGYCFHTMGVDRTLSSGATIFNWISNGGAFEGADDLWADVTNNVKQFINTNGGNAVMYNPAVYTVRPKWNNVKSFLLGEITFQQLKDQLHCP